MRLPRSLRLTSQRYSTIEIVKRESKGKLSVGEGSPQSVVFLYALRNGAVERLCSALFTRLGHEFQVSPRINHSDPLAHLLDLVSELLEGDDPTFLGQTERVKGRSFEIAVRLQPCRQPHTSEGLPPFAGALC